MHRRLNTLGPLLLLTLAFVLGAGLRLRDINSAGYNSDEAVYAGQAAAIVQDPTLKMLFPVFRAHPLLFQFILALTFQNGVVDIWGRYVAVGVGLANVGLVYLLGQRLYGAWAGAFAALFLALMPYHITVSRQVLLDGPLSLCATLSLYLLACFAHTKHPAWLYATGAGMGLTFLSKETGIVLMGAIYAFLALSVEIKVRLRDVVLATLVMGAVILPFPVSILLGGGAQAGEKYLVWQLFRRPNHDWDFYLTMVPNAIGWPIILVALLGVALLFKERTWREKLLLAWVIVPTVFFQLWPTKGFQYLLPTAAPLVVLAGRALTRSLPALEIALQRAIRPQVKAAAVGSLAVMLLLPTWPQIQPAQSTSFLAGSGGLVGGREAGGWIATHTPEGATFMTIGPSIANVIRFYGHREAYGLSVSPNPLRRNPSYQPVYNPDRLIRNGDLHYLVWDSFSAARTPFFAEKLLSYAHNYHGRVVHVQSVTITHFNGSVTHEPVIIIYEVRP